MQLIGNANLTLPSNLTVSSGALVVDSTTNRVGIGNTSPQAFLDIIGATNTEASVRVRTGAQPSSPSVGDIYSDGTDLFFYDGTTWRDLTVETTSSGGFTDDGPVVRLTTVGDFLGIGTANPTEKITVQGNATVTGNIYAGSNLVYAGGQSNGDIGLLGWTDSGTVVHLAEGTDLVAIGSTTGTEKLFVDGNVSLNNTLFVVGDGRVGIGTTDAGAALEVVGNINSSGIIEASQFVGDGSLLTGLGLGTIFNNENITSFLGHPNESILTIDNVTFVTSQTIGGELSGTIANAVISNTALDDQYVQLENQFDNENFTTRYDQRTDRFGNENVTSIVGDNETIALWNQSGTGIFLRDATQNVGIGTDSPTQKLTVIGQANVTGGIAVNDTLFVNGSRVGIGTSNPSSLLYVARNDASFAPNSNANEFTVASTGSNVGMSLLTDDSRDVNLYFGSTSNSVGSFIRWNHDDGLFTIAAVRNNNADISFVTTTGGVQNDRLRITNGGNIGIGTNAPLAQLHVNATSGNIITGTNASDVVFTVANDGEVFSDVGFSSPAADVAERFVMTDAVEPGDVVVIDVTSNEQLKKSTTAYDRLVAGVISTTPAVKLGPEGEYVALAGRVPVKITGAVTRGDLLTTSNIPGTAMACSDTSQCVGAIVGKALTEPEGGKVIALISLQ